MKPSISVIAAARRFLAIPPRGLLSRKKKRAPVSYSSRSSLAKSVSLSLFFFFMREGMLTRCSAPTFMEMHPLIYPGSACSRLCLTSVLREVYYLPRARPALASFFPYRSLDPLLRLRHLAFTSSSVSSDLPPSSLPLPPDDSTFDASHSRTIRIRFPIRLG